MLKYLLKRMTAEAVNEDNLSAVTDPPTILDYLNEDCWRAILDYVPTRDIIQSETVCQRWQRVVLSYLRGARIGIEHPYPSLGSNELHRSVGWVLIRDHAYRPISFHHWTNKLGPSLVSTFCTSEDCLKIIGENCPNLEAIKFMKLPDELLRSSRSEHFRWLQRICFIECPLVSDRCVSQFAASYALEEIEIHNNKRVTGQCLQKIRPDLKSLVLNQCSALETVHLLSAFDRFRDLTKLVLNLHYGYDNPYRSYLPVPYRNMFHVLKKLRKLEHLEIYFNFSDVIMENDFIHLICNLGNLRHFAGAPISTDNQLDRVTRYCRELRSLNMEGCTGVTPQGVAVACRNAPRLTALGFHGCRLTDDNVVACVRACPDLTSLDVRRSRGLTRALMARAAAARRRLRTTRPLYLYLDNILMDLRINGDLDKYDELIIHF